MCKEARVSGVAILNGEQNGALAKSETRRSKPGMTEETQKKQRSICA